MKRFCLLLMALLMTVLLGCALANGTATPTDLPATATDLFATATDLTATATDLVATPSDLPGVARRDCIVDLTLDPNAVWTFEPDVPVLEIVIPQVTMADAAILRIDGHVMMIDAAGATETASIRNALEWMGVTEIETAICTHPHHDHMPGFALAAEYVTIDRLLTPFGPGASMVMDQELPKLAELGIPVEPIADGDVVTIAGVGEQIVAIQRAFGGANVNNRSLITLVTYGERSILLTADIEKDTQKRLVTEPPACGLSADIVKYPHHGLARMQEKLVEAIAPALAIITNSPGGNVLGDARMAEYFIPVMYTVDGAIRLRTDGQIWVVDRLTGPEN